ncbi:class I SAM-dependent methyltransferase [Desmospora profundinema]|uniref:SAM-dependent methyltransferase n=1 Tax=Desmospora profundinema TaxID=1571184 RepID=A0ABU1IKB6_9BACL|nr:class I SAM-dependent methyltransferase [Desmospora profundinema]MDR6225222.1 SAM-dependent methyltransferase [Desmospora profundinema]
MSQPDAYNPFADVYHRHWGNFADQILPIIEASVLQRLPPGSPILDLCCGTGGLAKKLTEDGWDVTGVDGSASMLEIARREAPRARFQQADAQDFHYESCFAAVFSTYDSLNHILEWNGVRKTFSNVRRALTPGGWFFFDLNMRKGYQNRWKGQFHIVKDDHAVMVSSRYDDERRIAFMDFTLFTREQDHWHRSDFTLTQRCYEEEQVIGALREAGFSDIEVHDTSRFDWNQIGRSIFIARSHP